MGNLHDHLQQAGQFGPAQYLMIVACIASQMVCGWMGEMPVFFAIDVPFQCVKNSTADIFVIDIMQSSGNDSNSFDSVCSEHCDTIRYKSEPSSIISQFDLACGEGPTLVSTANSAYWVGFLTGCLASGTPADVFGRRIVSLFSSVILLIVTWLLAFCSNIYEFIAVRFFCGLSYCPLSTAGYILVAEWCDKEKFALVAMTAFVVIGIGQVLCGAVAYVFVHSWKTQVFIAGSTLIVVWFLYFFLVPESPVWLYQAKKYKKCEKVLRTVGKRNGKNVENLVVEPEESEKDEQKSSDEDEIFLIGRETSKISKNSEQKETFVDLFRTAKASLLMVTNMASWFSMILVYYGLSFSASSLKGNIYTNCVLLGLAETPAWFVCFAMDFFGRKKTVCFCMLLSSLACLSIPLVDNIDKMSLVAALLGKMLATSASNLLYVYTPEQLPTLLRTTGLSICSASARLAPISAPYFIQMRKVSPYIPYSTFAASGFLSTFLCLLFQVETLHRPMPHTLQEYYSLAAT